MKATFWIVSCSEDHAGCGRETVQKTHCEEHGLHIPVPALEEAQARPLIQSENKVLRPFVNTIKLFTLR